MSSYLLRISCRKPDRFRLYVNVLQMITIFYSIAVCIQDIVDYGTFVAFL